MPIRRRAVLLAATTLFLPAAAVSAGSSASGSSGSTELSPACTSAVAASEAHRIGVLPGLVDERTERVAEYEADLEAAEEALAAAEEEVVVAQSALTAAEEALVVAEEELVQAEESGTPEEVEAAQEAVVQAREARESAQTTADEADATRSDAYDVAVALRSIVANEERPGLELLVEFVEGPPLDPATTTEAELTAVIEVTDYLVDEEYAALLGEVVNACYDETAAPSKPSPGSGEPTTAPAAQPVKARADYTG